MRLVVLWFFSLLFLYASPTILLTDDRVAKQDFKLEYCADPNQDISIQSVAKEHFIPLTNRTNFPYQYQSIWYRLSFLNQTESDLQLYIHNNFAFMMFTLEFYEVKNQALLSTKSFDFNSPMIAEKMMGATARFGFEIKSKESKEIYIHATAPMLNYIDLNIYDDENSLKGLIELKLTEMIFVGILVGLTLFNLLLFISSKHIEYLYYALYIFVSLVWIVQLYGVLSQEFGVFGDVMFRFNYALYSIPIFLSLFVKTVFKTAIRYRYADYALNGIIVTSLAFIGYFAYEPYSAISDAQIISQLVFLTFIGVAIYLYIKKDPLAKYFLFANMLLFIFGSIAGAFYAGVLPYSYLTFYATGFSVILEALALAFMLAARIRILEHQNAQTQQALIDKSKKAQLGEMISIIAHQWKQPLAIISGYIATYKLNKEMNTPVNNEKIDTIFGEISQQVEYASETIDEFRHFFNPDKKPSITNISKVLNTAVELLYPILIKGGVKVNTDIKAPRSIVTYNSDLIQVIINIIKNSLDQFELLKQKDKEIDIISYFHEDKCIIEITDNGGGVDEGVLPYIFEPYFSTKDDENGTGLGLDLCKRIIEERCKGIISASNVENGAKFTIVLGSLAD